MSPQCEPTPFVNSLVITDKVVCAHKEKQPEGGLVEWVQG